MRTKWTLPFSSFTITQVSPPTESPSKSAPNPLITSGGMKIDLPLTALGLKASIPYLCNVGARFKRSGLSVFGFQNHGNFGTTI